MKDPRWITEGHKMFDNATVSGRYLWPSQREAFVAGYGTIYDKMEKLEAENRELKIKLTQRELVKPATLESSDTVPYEGYR